MPAVAPHLCDQAFLLGLRRDIGRQQATRQMIISMARSTLSSATVVGVAAGMGPSHRATLSALLDGSPWTSSDRPAREDADRPPDRQLRKRSRSTAATSSSQVGYSRKASDRA